MGLLTTKAYWTDAPDLPGLKIRRDDNRNRSEIRWGNPVDGGNQSGYDFEGHGTSGELGGDDFPLGTFTHHNYPIILGSFEKFSLTLQLQVYFQDHDLLHECRLVFDHDETPNVGDHWNDQVTLPDVHPDDAKVHVNGVEYTVTITGFLVGSGAHKTKQPSFDTPEGEELSAKIFARFKQTGPQGS
ncbi:choice-of-anchor K domain-containing protein [Streptomyces mayteni]